MSAPLAPERQTASATGRATAGMRGRLLAGGRSRTLGGFAIAAALLFGVAPAVLSDFRLNLLAKFLCLAMVAVGIGLAWGRGGMLTLGQGVYFGLGGYLMAMHLKLADAGPGGVPDFMLLYGDGTVPGWWEPFRSPVVTIIAIVAVPVLVATGLGWAVFSRRVRGAYFAILSQALAAAFAILLIGQQKVTGGTNGLNGFRSFFGFDLADPVNKRMLFFIAAGTLLVMVAVVRLLMVSRFGELLVAVRDQENRVRFLGYDPALVKVVAYAVAAAFAGIGGALFVPIVGIISPADVGVVPSIAFLVGVAIGGRATLLGPVLGAIAVSWAQTSLSESFPSMWIYFQGALFILVVAFLPGGLASLGGAWRRRRSPAAEPTIPVAPDDDPVAAGLAVSADPAEAGVAGAQPDPSATTAGRLT
ncbi:urea ABC transporter permease subunit UrtC [Cellulomonas chengniuliangii]|uniref:Urea ABC transporter permease subunit UrtC n=1 Tax=Cellulomonas chengniuliangii TaxID=2968084 RepID=A0ABY5L229_9CELL|nr:urea ABC transporter permease subunit UrtC [Cellulomonas chengniuliangii]MCC2307300.1 urea ABC transporter permease subunit UrtC [Cellulomonas chengniuliangii]UUI75909.1 urea ABC transporter permease subunit UrtC [Cellulomonas chengniuliangii]